MNFTVALALFGWPVISLALYAWLTPRRAIIVSIIIGWLFLPVASFAVPGLPNWTKTSAISLSLLLGLLVFDFRGLIRFRPGLIDLPMMVWCICPIASSVTNGLGLYDGLAATLDKTLTWGIPYLVGRQYLRTPEALADLALGLFLGGLAYAPFCLFEIRMSPHLNEWIYGFRQQGFEHSHRFGGWRPSVFMAHGLMVGMWMTMATLVGIWLRYSGVLRSLLGFRLPWFLIPLGVTAVLCKSTGAVVLLVVGVVLMLLLRWFPARWPIYVLALAAPLYIAVRISGLWSGGELVGAAGQLGRERADSIQTRLYQEDLLSAKALQQPVFGWGGWGRSRVVNDIGEDVSITDGLWIIALGEHGLVGLGAMLGIFVLPLFALVRSYSPREWTRPEGAPVAVLAVVVGLYLIDCIPNAMITPIYILAAGGLTGLMFRESSLGSSEYPDLPPGPPTPGSLSHRYPSRLER